MKDNLEYGRIECPICHSELEELDCTDIETSFNYVRLFAVGCCPSCDKYYQWREKFIYEGYSDLEEVDLQD